jgi:Stress responsive A/B Barrel Domain
MHTFVSLRLITLPTRRVSERDAIVAQLAQAAANLGAMGSHWIAAVLDGACLNAGHIVWRMESNTEAAALDVSLDPVWSSHVLPLLDGVQMTTVGYRIMRSSVRQAGEGIWRALVFRVIPAGFPDGAAALESQLLLMPKYVPAIRSWALSPVSFDEGPKHFTHVWEQEFDDVSGLTEDYMVHPIHWGLVDTWFDAESPNYVVDPLLIQVVARINQTIMS